MENKDWATLVKRLPNPTRIFRDKAGDRWLYAEDLVCLLDELDMLRVQLSNERKVSDMMAKSRVNRASFVPTPTGSQGSKDDK